MDTRKAAETGAFVTKVFERFGSIGKRGHGNDTGTLPRPKAARVHEPMAGTPPRPKAAKVHEPMTTSKKSSVDVMLSVPLNPKGKNRKTQALALRTRLAKADKAKTKAQGKPKAAKKDAKKPTDTKDNKDQKVPKDADKIIHKPQLCVSKGPNVRVELCATGLDKKRVYVFGATKNTYGENLKRHAEELKKFIEDSMDITKADVLNFLKTLQEKEPK